MKKWMLAYFDTTITSRKRKRKEFNKIIIKTDVAFVVYMIMGVITWYHNNHFVKEPTHNWELE